MPVELVRKTGLLAILLLMPICGFGQTPALKDLPTDELLERIDAAPDNGAARLEFARREFAAQRDASAGFNARQAIATGTLTIYQESDARDILSALQRRRTWIFDFDAALAPTTSRQEFFDPEPDNDSDDDVVLQTVNSGVGLTGFGAGQ